MAKNKGPQYKPDPFQKAMTAASGRLLGSRENVLYAVLAAAVVILIAAWAVASWRRGGSEQALNEIALAFEKGDRDIEDALRRNAGFDAVVPYAVQYGNMKYMEASMVEEGVGKAPLSPAPKNPSGS